MVRKKERYGSRKKHSSVKRRKRQLSKVSWSRLTENQKRNRVLSLKALTLMRKGKSLSYVSSELGIDSETIKSHVRSAVVKKGKKWRARKKDRIQRALVINENGESKTIIVVSSRYASIIGDYHNAVKKFLETGDESLLKRFKRITIKDSRGRKHKLETDPKKLFDIEDAREDSEFFDIYGD